MSLAELFAMKQNLRQWVQKQRFRPKPKRKNAFTLEALEPRLLLSGTPMEGLTPQESAPGLVQLAADGATGSGDLQGLVVIDQLAKQLIESGDAVAVQGDGKILIAGSATDGFGRFFPDITLVRLNADGTPDRSFGTEGQITFDFGGDYYSREEAFAVALQADGKIVVAGRSALTDTAVAPIDFDFALARFTATGAVDTTFGTGGFVRTGFGSASDAARGLAVLANGTIYAVGESGGDAAVARYTSAGVLDTTFDGDGKVVRDLGGADSLRGAVVQIDGKLVAAGTTALDFAAVRFTTNGALDAGFGNAGVALVDFGNTGEEARALALDVNGRIVLGGGVRVGTANDFALARLTTAGVLDTGFGTGGKTTFNVSVNPTSGGLERIEGLAVQTDGKIVVAGTAPGDFNRPQWHAARVDASGALDAGFGTGGITRLGLDIATFGKAAGVVLSGGQVVIAGTRQSDNALQPYSLGVMKLTTGGALDQAFDGDGVALFDVRGPAQNGAEVSTLLADGRILLAENVRITPGNALAGSIIALTRLLADGSRDATFGVNGTVNIDFGGSASTPHAVLVQPDGKILLAGTRYFLPAPDGVLLGESMLARLNSNGSRDATFGTGGIVTDQIFGPTFRYESEFLDIVRQTDGKLVALGYGSDAFREHTIVVVNRYNADGTLDATFAGDGRAELDVQAFGSTMDTLRLFSDGRLLIAGEDNRGTLQFARLTATGTLDTTFSGDGIASLDISGGLGGVIVNGDGTITAGAAGRGSVSSGGTAYSNVTLPIVLQLTTSGELDPSFGIGGILGLQADPGRSGVGSFVRDSVGRFVMTVGFRDLNDHDSLTLVRFNTDGSRDQHFGADEGIDLHAIGIDFVRNSFLRANGTLILVGGSLSPENAVVASFTTEAVVPAAGLLSFNVQGSTVAETVGHALIDVVRLGGSTGTVTVNYAITGGTAQAGSDFTTVGGTLTFLNGATTQQISVPILADTIGELAETIELTLTNATGGAALQHPAKHELTILAHNGGLGSIDPNFGVNGVALSDHSATTGNVADFEQITDMAFAPDGDIIAVGTTYHGSDIFLSRFHADGSPDLAFGDRGSATTDVRLSLDGAERVGVLPDGRILVAGYGFTPEFGDGVHYGGTTQSLSSGGKQLVLSRYNADGTLDRSYGDNGLAIFDPRSLPGRTGVATEVLYEDYVILPTGEVVAGIVVYDFLNSAGTTTPAEGGLIRFRSDGTLDTTFGGDGFAESGLVGSRNSTVTLAQQPNGTYLLAFGTGDFQGPAEERIGVARFNTVGSLDTSFGTNGRLQFDAFLGVQSVEYPRSIALQQDGKILIGGDYSPFGGDGQSNPDVAARDDSGFIARLNANGTLDTSFSADGLVYYHGLFPRTSAAQSSGISDGFIYEIAQLPNGRITAVAESFDGPGVDFLQDVPVVLEFLADGTPDAQFGINGALRLTSVHTDALLGILDAALLVTPSNEIIAGYGGKLSSDTSQNSQFTLQRLSTQNAAGRIEWSLAASEVEESDGAASLILQRLGGTTGTVTVSYAFASGTALAGADFTSLGGTITFLDGQSSVEILVPITTGDALENTETFTVTLTNPTGGAALGAISTHQISIVDGPDRFEFTSPVFNFLEGSQLVSVQVLRKGGATGQVSVDYSLHGIEAVNGVDFDAQEGGTLAFASGQKSASITFALRADDVVEGRESLALTLLNPRGGPILGAVTSTTASIYDSEPGKGKNAGALDAGFGLGGVAQADVFPGGTAEQGRDVVTLQDGKLLGVGESGGHGSDFLLARYLADGTLDTSFGIGGVMMTDFFGGADSARSVALDAQGRMVVAGWALLDGHADFAVARYLANGTLDVSFSGDGRATVDFSGFDDRASSVAVATDGRIVLGGWTSGVQKFDMAVAVLTDNGTLDVNFDADGRATVDFDGKQDMANTLLVQQNGAIVLGGTSSRLSSVTAETASDFSLVRFTAAGDLDLTFSGDGKLLSREGAGTTTTNSVLNAMVLRADGRIIFGGGISGDIMLGEVSTAGALTFFTNQNFTSVQLGGGTTFTSSVDVINDLAFASNGQLVATGHTIFPGETTQRLFVKRYQPDYRFDVDFGVTSTSVLPTLGSARALAFAENGNIVTVGGAFEVAQMLKDSAAPKEGAFALNAVSYAIEEAGGALTVTVSRSHETNYGFATVDYAVVGISAQPGLDFTPVAGTLVFRETETVKSFVIPILNDALNESTELFGIVLSNPTGGAQLSSASYATVAIPTNDPTAKSGGFAPTAPDFSDFIIEGFAQITVRRTGGSLGAVSIDYHTEDGTAKAGEDYTPSFGTINFAAGQTSQQIFILTTSDDRIEGNETMFLKFTTPTGGSTLDLGLDTMTIVIPDSVPSEAFPYAGNMDVTFDTDGRVTTTSGVAGPDNFFAVAQQIDGKLVAVGQAGTSGGLFIARYNADGSLDAGFGTAGKIVTSLGSNNEELALGLRIQSDGKILVLGASAADGKREEIVMARYSASGVLDPTFGTLGLARTPLQLGFSALRFVQGNGDVAITPDGKFVVGMDAFNGTDSDLALLRFLPTGALDTTFGNGGTLTYDLGLSGDSLGSVTVQPDGKIIATFGSGLSRAVRFNVNGSVDTTFGAGGVVSANPAATLLSPGLIYTDTALITESLVLTDGDILLFGSAFGSAKPANSPLNFTESLGGGVLILRYNADGTPDAAFGTNGVKEVVDTRITTIHDAVLDEAGKILLAGDNNVARILPDGRSDPGFGPNGVSVGLGTTPSAVLVQPNGRVLAVGGNSFSSTGAKLTRQVGGPAAGAFRLNVLTEQINERGGNLVIPIERVAGLDGVVSVIFSTVNGTATAGSDFTATSQTLSWGNFEDGVKSVSIPITDDLLADANETFTFTLSSPIGGAILSVSKTGTVTIVDDDQPGVLTFASPAVLVRENDGTATLTVRRTDGDLGAVSASYSVTGGTAIVGQDFVALSGTVNFATGEREKTITVSLVDDFTIGDDKTLVVTLAGPQGGATLGSLPSTRLTIQNDELPKGGLFGFGATQFETREDSGGSLVTVLRTGGSNGAATVNLTVAPGTAQIGLDFIPFVTTLVFLDGQTSASAFIPIFDNSHVDPSRTLLLSLDAPTGERVLTTLTKPAIGPDGVAVLIIADNDAFPVRRLVGSIQLLANSSTAGESSGAAPIVVLRADGTAGAVSVLVSFASGTAQAGQDFTATPILVTFADGELSKTLFVPLINDLISEPAETFTVALSNPTGGAALGVITSGTVTITDDDVDAVPPTSGVASLPATTFTPSFTVAWSGSDVGSGVATYDLFVSDNGAAFTAFLVGTTSTATTFTGQGGHTYGFYSVATDNSGLRETAPATPDAVTMVRLATIQGLAFEDVNVNGVRNAGDQSVAGRTIFIDANNDGLFNASESRTTTDVNGTYAFTNLSPGIYSLKEALPAGWFQTAPAASSHIVVIAGGETQTGKDFGALHATLDVDGNGTADALTDGIVIVRYLFGFTGDALINGVVDPSGTRATAQAVEGYLNGVRPLMLDVDANSQADALSDGIVTVRFLFGFTANSLIAGAVDPNGIRNTAAAIEAFLQGFLPIVSPLAQQEAVVASAVVAPASAVMTTVNDVTAEVQPLVDLSAGTAASSTNEPTSLETYGLAYVQQSWVKGYVATTADVTAEDEELLIQLT